MESMEQLSQNYNSTIEQVLTMLVSPSYGLYEKAMKKYGFTTYPLDPKHEYLFQYEIFVAVLAARKKLLIPVIMGGVRSRYQKTIDYLEDSFKAHFKDVEGGGSSSSPYWGGIAELCLNILSIEQNKPIVLLPPENPLPIKPNVIAATKLNELNQVLELPQRLLLGVDDRYFMFVNEFLNDAIDAS